MYQLLQQSQQMANIQTNIHSSQGGTSANGNMGYVPQSPSSSDTYSITPSPSLSPSILTIPYIPNIPFNPTPFLNCNLSNLNWSWTTQQSLTNQLAITTNTSHTMENNTTELKGKKTIYIEREMVKFVNQFCVELFHTNEQNDMKLLFAHIKESNAIQINLHQIHIHNTPQGPIIISNIDLHFQDGQVMYLIGMPNDFPFNKTVPWKIVTIMRADKLYKYFGITQDKLPQSSRDMPDFKEQLDVTPDNVPMSIITQTNFKRLPKKESKRHDEKNKMAVRIHERDLKYYCRKSWNNGMFLPVVVIKDSKQWIEWKKFVQIFPDQNGNEQWVGISLRYHWANKQWKIECMDYDAGRVFYQFRLVGDNHGYFYSYNDLRQLINTKLNIF